MLSVLHAAGATPIVPVSAPVARPTPEPEPIDRGCEYPSAEAMAAAVDAMLLGALLIDDGNGPVDRFEAESTPTPEPTASPR